MRPVEAYVQDVQDTYHTGKATELSYRPCLETFLEELLLNVVVTNDPKRQACGAPDFIISPTENKQGVEPTYIETKDIGKKLDTLERSEQIERYKESLDHFILTDYFEFRFFISGKKVFEERIASLKKSGIELLSDHFIPLEKQLKTFVTAQVPLITSPKELAEKMASRTRLMRDVFYKAVTSPEDSSLKQQLAAFRKILIPDMDEREFADIYAQTLAYGLFTARLHDNSPGTFCRQESCELISPNNPFLRKLFLDVANDLDDKVSWIVDDLCSVYRSVNLKTLLKEFKQENPHSDPIIHFYETFLSNYDADTRKKRGVWYTPKPIVNFIVRAVDDCLKQYFDLPEGLADTSTINSFHSNSKGKSKQVKDVHNVQILDIATGTGTFLAEVIEQIHQRFKTNKKQWSAYVDKHLLPRLHGFEILMAPYAMCHAKLDLLLQETGYQFNHKSPRLGVYLTNALEEHQTDVDVLFADWFLKEAEQANQIKQNMPVMVVMGNPPYSVSSQNKGEWITQLIKDYKEGLNERKINLDDDYIKFIRYAEYYIEKNGYGIVALITNNSFLDGVTHRQMRKHLLKTFDTIYIYDLHGSIKKKEKTPDGKLDQNVFDIQQGVSISILIKHKKDNKNLADVFHCEVFGTQKEKHEKLLEQSIETASFKQLDYKEPYYFFVPKDFKAEEKYNSGFSMSEIFVECSSGIETKNDKLSIQFDKKKLEKILTDFKIMNEIDLTNKYLLKRTSGWNVSDAISDLKENDYIHTKILYRPFDIRKTVLTKKSSGFIGRPRYKIMSHLCQKENFSLCTMRQVFQECPTYNHVFISNVISDRRSIYSNRGASNVYPVYLYNQSNQESLVNEKYRIPNVNINIINQISKQLSLKFIPDHNDKAETDHNSFSPLDLLDYIYAVLHSPNYRKKHKEFLKIDFPRVPYPTEAKLFWQLVQCGQELRLLHLMEHPKLGKFITTFPQRGGNQIDQVKADFKDNASSGRVYINKEQYFDKVPCIAWEFYIGGYQPAQKWLKDRKGRTLSAEDIAHWQKIIVALQETNRIMQAIDKIWTV